MIRRLLGFEKQKRESRIEESRNEDSESWDRLTLSQNEKRRSTGNSCFQLSNENPLKIILKIDLEDGDIIDLKD